MSTFLGEDSSPGVDLVPDLTCSPPCVLSDEDLKASLLIRSFEEVLLALFDQGHLAGTTHTCLGQEYIPVALTKLARPSYTFSNHRGHGHYIAQFEEITSLLAEVTGREGGVCGGYGGSQHLLRDGFCSSGVQGQGVPLALGAALHLKNHRKSGVALAYIGDGTWGEGSVYEALNMASLWAVPLIIAVENNGIAQTTPTTTAMAGTVSGRAAAFGVRFVRVEERCVSCIRALLSGPVAEVESGRGPLVVEFVTDRLGPHSKGDDTRSAQAVEAARSRDWLPRYQQAHPEQFARIHAVVACEVEDVTTAVLARPLAGIHL